MKRTKLAGLNAMLSAIIGSETFPTKLKRETKNWKDQNSFQFLVFTFQFVRKRKTRRLAHLNSSFTHHGARYDVINAS